MSLDSALNSTSIFSLCWKLLVVWPKTCTLLVWGNCFWGKHGLGPPLQAAVPWGGGSGCWGDTWQPSGKVTASCHGLLPCTAEEAPWEAPPSPLPMGSKGAVSSGISAICSRDPGPAEGFNPAQGREESPRASLPIPVLGSSPAARDSPLPGGRGTSGAPRGAGFGDPDPHQSPLVTSHAEAARLCLD